MSKQTRKRIILEIVTFADTALVIGLYATLALVAGDCWVKGIQNKKKNKQLILWNLIFNEVVFDYY